MKYHLLECVLHFSDIGNTMKNIELCIIWAERVVEEFRKQGDREIELFGKVMQSAAMFKRSYPLEESQIGWIDYVMLNCAKIWAILNPDMKWIVKQVEKNRQYWQTVRDKKKNEKNEKNTK